MYDDQEFYNSLLNQYASLAMNQNAKVIRQRSTKKKEIQRKASKGRHLIYNVRVGEWIERRFIPSCRTSARRRSTPLRILMCSSSSPPCSERLRIEVSCFSSSCLVHFASLFYTGWKIEIVEKTTPCFTRSPRHRISSTTPLPVFRSLLLFRRSHSSFVARCCHPSLLQPGPPVVKRGVRERSLQPRKCVHL